MNTARQVAHYFLSFTDEEAGEFISNMKLQKLILRKDKTREQQLFLKS